MKVSISSSANLYYRGIVGRYDPNKFPPVIWVTQDIEYAKLYAENADSIHAFRVRHKRSFDFGFRTLQVHVRLEDVLDRVRRGVTDAFSDKRISRDVGLSLFDRLDDLQGSHPNTMLRVWEWVQKVQRDIVPILEQIGYDSIVAREGVNNNVLTYGLFDKRQLTKV